jgi:Fur family zinc uptake transcriptional regulator
MGRQSKYRVHPRDLVLQTLKNSGKPLSAYTLLAELRPMGIKAPTIIYRALDALIKEGAVHKINELSAYIACDRTDDHNHSLSVLTVCHDCQKVVELHDDKVIHQLEALRGQGVRLSERAVIELSIICEACNE